MLTVEIAVDPILLRLGPLTVRWYGLTLVVALLAGCWLMLRWRERAALSRAEVFALLARGVVLGVIGGRLAEVIAHPDYYALHPLATVALQDGGFVSAGAWLGGLVAGLTFAGRGRRDFWRLLDLAAPAAALGLAIVAIGATIAGDGVGLPSGAGWGLVYTNPASQVPRDLLGMPARPAPVFELLVDVAIFAWLTALRPWRLPPGSLGLSWLCLSVAGQALVGLARLAPAEVAGLSTGQVVAGATLALGAPWLLRRWRRPADGG